MSTGMRYKLALIVDQAPVLPGRMAVTLPKTKDGFKAPPKGFCRCKVRMKAPNVLVADLSTALFDGVARER